MPPGTANISNAEKEQQKKVFDELLVLLMEFKVTPRCFSKDPRPTTRIYKVSLPEVVAEEEQDAPINLSKKPSVKIPKKDISKIRHGHPRLKAFTDWRERQHFGRRVRNGRTSTRPARP